jgi:predicted RNase H-like HicB family nuclease
MKKYYRVQFDKDADSGWWVVTVPEIRGCLTQGRSLAEGRRRIREALALFIDEKLAATVDLVDDVRLPGSTGAVVKQAAAVRAQLDELQAEAIKATSAAAKLLVRKSGLSVRDAGDLLGVSYQRIQQLAGAGKQG